MNPTKTATANETSRFSRKPETIKKAINAKIRPLAPMWTLGPSKKPQQKTAQQNKFDNDLPRLGP